MLQIKTVLCPIDFSDLTRRELGLAVEVCEAFGARLVLHHNVAGVAPGFSTSWQWKEVHQTAGTPAKTPEEHLREILAGLPRSIQAEASVSSGPLAAILLQLAEGLPADLVVLGSHGWSTVEHASVTERVIDGCPCPVLTIDEGHGQWAPFRLRTAAGEEVSNVVVPTDFTDSSASAVRYAFELARRAPVRIHLLHIITASRSEVEAAHAQQRTGDLLPSEVGSPAWLVPLARTALHRLVELVPSDLSEQVRLHVEAGDPIQEILGFTARTQAAFIIMGEHARGFFRRFFAKNTAREVLHRAECPVWFIPPGYTSR
jgi:universal stress protein A